ncbi:MAG: hypothetical protein Q9207_006247 [Kuettlingeria erythrocarpa]
MASRPTASRAPTGTNANPARRNLFHSHLIRRPTGSTTSGSTATSNAAPSPELRYDDSSDIVMRESNGEPQVQMPQLLSLDVEQAAEGNNGGLQNENQRLEDQLIETYKSRNLVPGDKTELLTAVQASLRRKVASLDDDNWMFEAAEVEAG